MRTSVERACLIFAVVVTCNASVSIALACTSARDCLGTAGHPFCIQGVCCDMACGPGSGHLCSSCLHADTNQPDGTCAPTFVPSSPCHASAGPCDTSTYCAGRSIDCPPSIQPAGTVCLARDPSNPCTVDSTCDGSSAGCAIQYASSSTVCNAAMAGPCDAPDYCSGTSATCLPSYQSGNMCRPASSGGCDQAAFCTGGGPNCPANPILPAGTQCGPPAGPCGNASACDGTSATCPAASVRPVGTVCALRDPSSPCSVDSLCDGTSPACTMRYAPSTTVCNPMVAGPCDLPDYCSGTSLTCVPNFQSGTMCRASAGPCDVAESCSGTSASCPPDGVLSSGIVCRMSTDPSCDAAEHCDGTGTSCPADVTTCTTMPDTGPPGHDAGMVMGDAAGTDAAGIHDAAVRDATASDATSGATDTGATPPPMTGSCGCRAGSRSGSGALAGLALLAMAIGSRRRASRH